MGPVSLYPVAMRAQELEVVQVVRPSPRLRDYMVNLEYLEREVHAAPRTAALLLPKKDVLVLAVVDRCIYVSAPGDICPGRDEAVVKEAPHKLLESSR